METCSITFVKDEFCFKKDPIKIQIETFVNLNNKLTLHFCTCLQYQEIASSPFFKNFNLL